MDRGVGTGVARGLGERCGGGRCEEGRHFRRCQGLGLSTLCRIHSILTNSRPADTRSVSAVGNTIEVTVPKVPCGTAAKQALRLPTMLQT